MPQKRLSLGSSFAELQDFLLTYLPQCYDLFECLLAVRGSLRNTGEEKFDPMLYVVGGSYDGKRVIIGSSIPLEKVREVKSRFRQEVPVNQIERYQESANPTIAVEKRVNGFKLIMAQRNPDQVRNGEPVVMPESFKVGKKLRQLVV